jgi:hypothetical protein
MSMTQRLAVSLMAFSMVVYAAPSGLQKNMSFTAARQHLLKERWKPLNLHRHDNYPFMGVEHELARHGIREFESCSIDYSDCIFHYQRGVQCLTVFTVGEHLESMRVVQWSDDCPAPSEVDRSPPQH